MDILIRADSCSDGGRNEPLPMSSAGPQVEMEEERPLRLL